MRTRFDFSDTFKQMKPFREDGNKLFNSDQAMQSILYYNKALSFAPHPSYDEWNNRQAVATDSNEFPDDFQQQVQNPHARWPIQAHV